MAELRINPDKVCELIEASRELAGKVPATTGDRTSTGDDSPFISMEDYGGADPRRQQIVELIGGLNVEEQADLLALLYVGRGDFDLADWEAALAEAEARIGSKDADFMIGDAALPGYLSDALDAFGKSCPEV